MRDAVAGLVLAGGSATRMGGGDKPLLDIGGRPMLARILDTLAADHTHVAISANGDPARFAAFARPVLSDHPFQGEGPLAGLLAGLDWAQGLGCTALLSVPGDTPFIPRGLAEALWPAPCCAADPGRTHHLVALWPVFARNALRALLSTPGPRRVAGFGATIGMRRRRMEHGQADRFSNINTPDELAAARLLAEEMDDPHGCGRRTGSDRPAAGPGT